MADQVKDADLHDYSNGLREDGLARRRPLEAQWYENLATYDGDFWTSYDIVNRKLYEPSKPDHKVRLPVNLAQPAVRTEYAKLLKNKPMMDTLARSNSIEDMDSAKVADKILSGYIEKNLSMPKHRRKMLQWVVICGCGGLFVDYDEKAMGEQSVIIGPDGSPVFDLRMISAIKKYYREKKRAPKTISIPQGELRHAALSPWQYIYDFSTTDYTNASWTIVSELYDVDEVFRRWGVEVEADNNAKPGVMARRIVERWDISNSMEWSRSNTYQKLVEVHRLFILPGHRYFPQGAEVVFTEKEVIDKTNFPYAHGELPVGIMGHIPMPLSQYSTSILPQIKPIVLEISKTQSQLIENRNMMGNPPWMEYRQNRIKGEIQNKPGMRLTVDWMPNVPEPHPIQMPEIPNYVQNLIPNLKEHVQEVSGQSEVSSGKVPAGARAGVTIAYLQEEDDTKLGPTVQEFEECMERVAWLDLKTIAEKYDTPRTIRLYKKNSEPEVFDFIGTMLEGVAGVEVQAGSALPRSKAAKQQFILDLWDRKIEQDPRKVREMLELGEGDADDWELDIQQAERENRAMDEGNPVTAVEWQNHVAHQYQHRRFMKSPEYDEMSPEVRQLYEHHDAEHTKFLMQQQQQQMVMQSMSGSAAAPAAGGANGQTNVAPDQGTGAPQAQGQGIMNGQGSENAMGEPPQ